MNTEQYHKMIEYTNLKSPNSKEIKTFVEKAGQEKYYGVCLHYSNIGLAAKYKTPELKLITVGGFPPIGSYPRFKDSQNPAINFYLGLYRPAEIDKVKRIIDDPNVDELDLVFPMYWYAKGELIRIHKFFKGVKDRFKKPVKVITEMGTIFKNRINLFEIGDIIEQSGCDFFKTNTGLIPLDFNLMIEGLRIIKETKPGLRIKASGGIRTYGQVAKLKFLGVERIGTSNLTNDVAQVGKETGNEGDKY